MARLGRLLTAMVTPFDAQDQLELKRAQALAVRLIESGSDGLVVAGTTGESPTLTHQEKLDLFRAVIEAVEGRGAVVAGTGSNNTAESVALTKEAERLGVAAVMLVGPYYNKPPQEGLYRHFRTVAEATSLPVIVYNVPGRTSKNIEASTVARLAEVPNIVAVKEASGDLNQVSDICRRVPAGFLVYSGDDSLTLPILSVGGYGVISVASHIVGSEMQEMIQSYAAGDAKRAAELHLHLSPLFKVLFLPSSASPAPVKSALNMLGFDAGGLRLPLVPTTEAENQQIAAVLEETGLLAATPASG